MNDSALIIRRSFFPRDLCDELIAFAEHRGFGEAPINVPGGPQRVEEIRNNRRVIVDDEHWAAELSEQLFGVLPTVGDWRYSGVNERFRFYRYEPGEYFRWHSDGSFVRSETERSFWTLMVYLNDGFEGGQTRFEGSGDDICVTPERGMLCMFRHELIHQGDVVRSGKKYVLRTDAMFRRAPELLAVAES